MSESQFSAMATRNQLGRESGRIEFSGTTRANRTRRRVSPETSGSQMSKAYPGVSMIDSFFFHLAVLCAQLPN